MSFIDVPSDFSPDTIIQAGTSIVLHVFHSESLLSTSSWDLGVNLPVLSINSEAYVLSKIVSFSYKHTCCGVENNELGL